MHVDDVTVVLRYFLENKYPAGETFNVGSGNPVSITEIAAAVKEIASKFGMKAIIKKVKAPHGKVWPDKWLAITRLQKYIKPYPVTSLSAGTEEMFLKLYEARKYDNTFSQAILRQ